MHSIKKNFFIFFVSSL